ncbi:unnamed protein product [Bursaphelenchus okinawaensis]|uniref:Uncharacterized protein n=1 Tax=Bursaphelenchus okinawaensis TaxID=465554 RepID=A0A811LEG7_9BILA|nr:unnamed protein product [Bursaphelenchus okinawaensis]CAG9121076.1 unnamed protein product [Bursaphelenchus okinawaensis]
MPAETGRAWHHHGQRVLSTVRSKENNRTCFNCLPIKTGTVIVGIVELVVVGLFLTTLLKQMSLKNRELNACFQRKWETCLKFHFSHSNITLAGDYVIALSMVAIGVCVLLMFIGICNTAPKMLLPHLAIQLLGLMVSLTYFGVYAWSYVYGDVYTHKRHFQFRQLVERMWFATMLLLGSIVQCGCFFTVLKCSLHLQRLQAEKYHRMQQFEEVSERVRRAKENGMWRNTSWGGGFAEYKGQNDEETEEKKREREERRKDRNAVRVKWNMEKNMEKSISLGVEENHSSTVTEEEEPKPKMETIKEKPKEMEKPAVKTVPQSSPKTSAQPSPKTGGQSSPKGGAQTSPKQLEGTPRSRQRRFSKDGRMQMSKSSSQDSGGSNFQMIPVMEVKAPPPPMRHVKKEKSSDSLLQGLTATPAHPSSASLQRHDHHRHRNNPSPPSPIRRTSVDSLGAPLRPGQRPQPKHIPPAAITSVNLQTVSGTSPLAARKYHGEPDKRQRRLTNEMETSSSSRRMEGSFHRQHYPPPVTVLPMVKKISITSKAGPAFPPTTDFPV